MRRRKAEEGDEAQEQDRKRSEKRKETTRVSNRRQGNKGMEIKDKAQKKQSAEKGTIWRTSGAMQRSPQTAPSFLSFPGTFRPFLLLAPVSLYFEVGFPLASRTSRRFPSHGVLVEFPLSVLLVSGFTSLRFLFFKVSPTFPPSLRGFSRPASMLSPAFFSCHALPPQLHVGALLTSVTTRACAACRIVCVPTCVTSSSMPTWKNS